MKRPGLTRFFGLRGKFIVLMSVAIAVTALVVGRSLTERIGTVYLDGLSKRAEQLTENLAYNAELAILVGDKDELRKLSDGVRRDKSALSVEFRDTEGVVVYNSRQASDRVSVVSQTPFGPDADSLGCQIVRAKTAGGAACLVVRAPIMSWAGAVDRERLGGISADANSAHGGHWEKLGFVTLVFDLEEANHAVGQAQMEAFALTGVVALLAIILTFVFVRFIVRPLESLAKASEEIAEGKVYRKLDIDRSDEIGALASSFDLMVDSLKRSQKEIESYHSTLEQKIHERTAELESAQEQLLQSEKMNAIGQLAAGVAHELNNPLAGILGYSQFALEKIKNKPLATFSEKDDASFQRYLNDIETQARRCKAIVQNLLRFSRSTRDIEATDYDLNSSVQETVELLRHQFDMHQLRLVTDFDPTVPLLYGNSGKLQQVFTNVMINAMHATPKGGTLTIRTKHAPTLGEFDGAVEISFSDTGSGISSENIKKIFEPFFTTKELGKGTGLGLSVSYGIVKEHGGEIKVHSETGVGTTFIVILPLQKKPITADTTKA